ncbi:MAG: PAS domain S-box protein [Alphaproteobacteria bacterium]|nr:MAG: PAS domain S-box protein [Alphaproteobacteria bacterium]
MNARVNQFTQLLRRLPGLLQGLRRRRFGARPEQPAASDLATQEALRESEERLRLVRRATGLGMYEIDWVARRRYWSPELRAILRAPADLDINTDIDLLERIIPNDMRTRFRAKLQASLDPERGGDYDDEHRITRFDGSTGWILLRGKTFFSEGAEGKRPTRSIGLIVDITDRKRGEEANALLASTVHSSTDAIFSIDPDLTIKTWNGGAEQLYGYTALEAIGRSLRVICPEKLHDEQAGLYRETMNGRPVLLETTRRHKDGHLIPVGISGSPIFSSEGRVIGVAAVHRDMTEHRAYEEHLAFTLRELSHRTKNLLAVVQGLAHMIARRSDDIDAFEARFRGCVQALAYSHDLLVQHDWQGATLEELLRVQLAPFGGVDGAKIVAQGPEVFLTPPTMQSLGLIMHELATNATKHGALSSPTGSVAIGWTRDPSDNGIRLNWQERGGPLVGQPKRKGFGQVVFERIGASLDGAISVDFRPEGFVCDVTIAANNLLSPGKRPQGDRPGAGGTVH